MATTKAKNQTETSNSFAVMTTGGKQYKVKVGDIVKIEKIIGEYKVGDSIAFNDVLLLDNGTETTVGAPFIKGSSVQTELTEIGRDAKVLVVHYKQKSKYFKKYGHRQPFFKVTIKAIA